MVETVQQPPTMIGAYNRGSCGSRKADDGLIADGLIADGLMADGLMADG